MQGENKQILNWSGHFTDCRQLTLTLLESLEPDLFFQQIHPEFSPVGWHFGHIAFTEALWILEKCQGRSPFLLEYRKLFAADGLPKAERQKLPTLEFIQDYLQTVRIQVLAYLEKTDCQEQERLLSWLLQHESQHCETIAFLLHLNRFKTVNFSCSNLELSNNSQNQQPIFIPAGEFLIGSDQTFAMDNERPQHQVYLESYEIDSHPVTQKEYLEFIEADGYKQSKFWSKTGWQWRENQNINQPLYWLEKEDFANHPVYGVSYYEAEAYATFKGKRLPTEAEWEKASYHPDFSPKIPEFSWELNSPYQGAKGEINKIPNCSWELNSPPYQGGKGGSNSVWEWTDSWFAPYPEFKPYPYTGYSQVYFDHQHRVLRGGSWVTSPWAFRNTFRNWYHPWVREIFVGFRCVQ